MTAAYPLTGPEAIEHALSKINLDELEEEQRQVIKSKKKTARPRAVRLLGIIAGLRKNEVGANELMLKSVPVIPPKFRPFSVTGDTFLPGDANEHYRDLLEYRRLYQKTEEALGREGSGEVYGDLMKAVRATYGFGDSPNPKTHARGVKGFFQAVTGTSPKTGFFQSKMLSKPVDTVSRGVIIPDANYDMNELGLPVEHAWKLYGSYIQRRLVRSGLSPAAALKHVKDRTPQAFKALESEMGVRPVVATRSPAWHKFNVIGANPRLVDGDAIRINTWVTDGLTADFDGDCKSLKENDLWLLNGDIFHGKFEDLLPMLDPLFPLRENSIHSLLPGALSVISLLEGVPTWLPVSHVHFHTKHGASVRVLLRSGFDLLTTDDHGMVVYDDDMRLEQVPPAALMGKKIVPVVYNLPVPVLRETAEWGGRARLLDYSLGYIVGHYLGDGGAYDNNEHVRIMSDDPEHLAAITSHFGGFEFSSVTARGKHKGYRLLDKDAWRWFRDNFGVGSYRKRIPSWIFGTPEVFRRGVLDGILSSDGHVKGSTRSAVVCVCSNSGPLIDDLALLSRTLGVWCSLEAFGKGKHFRLHLDPLDAPWLRLSHPSRQASLVEARLFLSGKSRQYGKVVPWSKSLQDRWLAHLCVGVSAARKMHNIFGSFYRTNGHASQLVARQFASTLSEQPTDPVLLGWLSLVWSQDACCVVVESVTEIPREEVTFDVTVPGPHLTVGPVSGLVTHQTMSIHLPSSDEAVKDVRERMMPDKMLWSVKDRDSVVPRPKHEQQIGLNLGGTQPLKNKRTFASDAEAMRAIETGQIDLNDDIDIDPAFVPPAPTFTPGAIDR